MKNKSIFLAQVFCLLFFATTLFAGPTTTTTFIKVDQFGYFPNSKKVAVISDPQVGNNAAEVFNAGTGANQYQVRRFSDDAIVFSGTIIAWGGGATHAQSGDRGWWFDFSSVTTPGSYYIFDVTNNVGSYQFDIGDNVYDNTLKQAMRMYYYQRLSYAKAAPYTDARWTDAAAYDGANQDRAARSRYAKTDAATARDLHGGWMDAGDVNKYTTFAESAVIQLAEAYRINPAAFKDDYNISESGNGIPDVIDELMFELDFLKRMQDGTGTNGFFLKIGVDNYNEVSPLSTDTRPKYYVPECTSSTLAGASMFAVAGAAFRNHANGTVAAYATDLIARAEAAWARAKITTSNFTVYDLNCDDGDIKSGDADRTAAAQLESAFVAAVYLYETTGKAEYKTFAESKYTGVNPYVINWWGPYWIPQQLALLRLTSLPGVNSTVISNIRSQKANMNYLQSLNDYTGATDLYRAHMADGQYHWGSNMPKTNGGHLNLDFVTFGINTGSAAAYREVAEQYLHYMHGVNPLTMVMLSNMYGHGAEKCVNEIYHTWFNDGTVWDNSLTSAKGPAPGYVTGGPNKSYSGTTANITNQPAQKAYKDWNAAYPENSWEITEPAIYSNASYVMLVARLVSGAVAPPDTQAPTPPTNLVATNITQTGLRLTWTAATDNVGVTAYEAYKGAILLNGNITGTSFDVTGLTCNTANSFTVKSKDAAGNKSAASNIANATTLACTVSTTDIVIYDEALATGWEDWSWGSTRNFNNTTPVKTGAKSLLVNYAGNGGLSLRKLNAALPTAATTLRFWVQTTAKASFKVFIQTDDNSAAGTSYTVNTTPNKWQEVVVTMSQMGNPAQIKRINVQNATTKAAIAYFDNIRLTAIQSSSVPYAGSISENETKIQEPVGLFPNPADGKIRVVYNAEKAEKITLQVASPAGVLLHQQPENAVAGTNTFTINSGGFTSGYYFVRVLTTSGNTVKKIFVQH
ncbi:MAG: glycoside hydrolase family 9 protein [Bacteroidota bacterium]